MKEREARLYKNAVVVKPIRNRSISVCIEEEDVYIIFKRADLTKEEIEIWGEKNIVKDKLLVNCTKISKLAAQGLLYALTNMNERGLLEDDEVHFTHKS